MLTQLSSLKTRLAIPEADSTHNSLLTSFIQAAGSHFEFKCGRMFERATNAADEFEGSQLEVCLQRYPVEIIHRFELKSNETAGWSEAVATGWLLRQNCVLSLAAPLGTSGQRARVIYTGGYVLSGTAVEAGQTPLPADLEQAVIEQAACWFMNRDNLGLLKNWPANGTFQAFSQWPLVPWVREVLRSHERWEL